MGSLFAPTFAAWPLWKGYASVANITVTSWNGVYVFNAVTNYNTGRDGYVYVSLPNMVSNKFVVFSGFNASGGFVGNITGFYYNNGFLLDNWTTQGKQYTTISAYYNPNVTASTVCSGSPLKCVITTYNFNNYFANNATAYSCSNPMESLTIYNVSFANDYLFRLKQLLPSNFSICNTESINHFTGVMSFWFAPNYPMLITASNRQYSNFSLSYVPSDLNTYSYSLNITNTASVLTSYGTLSNEYVNAPSSATPSMYLNPNSRSQYGLMSNGSGTYGVAYTSQAGYIFNSTIAKSPYTVWFPNLPEYQLNMYFPNISGAGLTPKINYFLIPAYTTNYIITANTVGSVQNPNIANVSNACPANFAYNVFGWFCDFQSRIQVSNITWKYYFNTSAYPNHLGTNYTIALNAAYTLITLPITYGMSCSSLYIRAGNLTSAGLFNDYGAVPFSVYSCTNQTVQLLIPNRTSGYNLLYNNLFVYYRSPSNAGDFENFSIKSSTQVVVKGTSFSYYATGNMPELLTLSASAPLNANSHINDLNLPTVEYNNQNFVIGDHSVGGVQNDYISAVGGATYCYPCQSGKQVNSNYLFNNNFILYTNATNALFMVAKTLSMIATTSTNVILYNTTTANALQYASYWNLNASVTLSGLTANLTKPYSTAYTITTYTDKPIITSGSNLTNGGLPPSNTTLNVSSLGSNSVFSPNNYNSIMSNLGLNVMINWSGFNMPMFVLVLIDLIVTIVILSFSDNTESVIIGIAFLWITGFVQIQIVPLVIILTIVFTVHTAVEKHK